MRSLEFNQPKGKVGQFLGNAGRAYLDLNASMLGLPELIPDTAYKGGTGEFFGQATNMGGSIAKAAAPMVLNAVAPGAGTALGVAQAGFGASGLNKPLNPPPLKAEKQTPQQPSYMKDTTYRAYKKGGLPKGEDVEILDEHVMVNVEKGELEVDPNTCEVVQEFNEVPKHPKGKNMINTKGNVYMGKRNVIIPAKLKDKFMSLDKKGRMALIKEVVANANGGQKKATGGTAPNGMELLPEEDTTLSLSSGLQKRVAQANFKDGVNYATTTGGNPYNLSAGAAAIPGLALGVDQIVQSNRALGDLAKIPLPKYEVTPEQIAARERAKKSFGRAEGLALSGFTPQEKAAYDQKVAKANATTLYNVRNQAGGQMSGTLNAALGSQSLNALLDFASQDAVLNRENIKYADSTGRYLDSTGQAITSQKNLGTQLEAQRRLLQEQAVGLAKSQGRTNTTNALAQISGSLANQFL